MRSDRSEPFLQVEIKLNPGPADEDLVTEIWFQWDEVSYPERYWVEDGLQLLRYWASQFTELLSEKNATLYFMEGSFDIDLHLADELVRWEFRYLDEIIAIKHSSIRALVLALLLAARKIRQELLLSGNPYLLGRARACVEQLEQSSKVLGLEADV